MAMALGFPGNADSAAREGISPGPPSLL